MKNNQKVIKYWERLKYTTSKNFDSIFFTNEGFIGKKNSILNA